MISHEELDYSVVGFVGVNVLNFDEKWKPVVLTKTVGAGGMEVLSVNVEFPIADINQNIELIFPFGWEKVIFRLIN